MYLTPKKLLSGILDRIKARLVAGGHRQDRSLYSDQETSLPTVSLTAVFAQAAIATHRRDFVMTLDHKAGYLNATMKGPEMSMMLSSEVSEILCEVCEDYTVDITGPSLYSCRKPSTAVSNPLCCGTRNYRAY